VGPAPDEHGHEPAPHGEVRALEDDWASGVHSPSPIYVIAFTLAHLGREAEARAALSKADTPEKLEPALERILRGA
jgi:hypothetical protein